MNEKIVVIGDQETLPSKCATCGGPVADRFHPVCEYCNNGITHAELIEEINGEKEKPVAAPEDQADEFANCEGSEEIDGTNTELDGGEYEVLTVSGVGIEISNVVAKELIVDGGTNIDIINCIVKKLVVNGGTNVELDNVKIYELLRVNGTNINGDAKLAKKAKFLPNGTNVDINVDRF